MTVKIKDIPKEERPREKLIMYGIEKISNEDLLAILIKSGTKNSSAKDIAIRVLKEIEKLSDLSELSLNKLKSIKGIGDSAACTILAAIEISKRFNIKIKSLNNIQILNSDIVFEYFNNLFHNKKQELFYCIYLDNKKCVIDNKLLFMGTINKSLVHPREVFKEACLLSAHSIICVHNHPSGCIEASNEDIDLTKRLSAIGYLIGIPILDHIIIGNNKYYSFLENGLMVNN